MRLVSLKVSDFKKAKLVELAFDGPGLKEIAGRNAQGKTSVLDALAAAFGGPKAIRNTEEPIREGADRAEVVCETDALTISRVWTPSGQVVRVSSKDGVQYTKPQQMLDKLFSDLTFDPLEFARSKPVDRRSRLIDALGLGMKLERIEGRRRAAYDSRRDANREVSRLEAVMWSLPEPDPFTPDEEVSSVEIIAKIRDAEARRSEFEKLKQICLDLQQDIERGAAEIARLKSDLAKAQSVWEEDSKELRATEGKVLAFELVDVEPLNADLAAIEDTNRAARDARLYRKTAGELDDARKVATGFDIQISQADEERGALLVEAALPVDCLEIGDEDLVYQGLPFSQASSAEQIRVSTAIAMRLQPELRVLRIAEGSLLDSTNREVIRELAEANDFLVLVETVRDEPTGSIDEIFIEDGEVADARGAA